MSPESRTRLEDWLPRWIPHMAARWCWLLVAGLSSFPHGPLLGIVLMSSWHGGHPSGQAIHETGAETAMPFMIWPRKSRTLTSTHATGHVSQRGRRLGEWVPEGKDPWGPPWRLVTIPLVTVSSLLKKQAFKVRQENTHTPYIFTYYFNI